MDQHTDVKKIRRNNLRRLAVQVGGITALARLLHKTPGQLSHIIGNNANKNIGDRLSYDIEQTLNLPSGWLDSVHEQTLEEETASAKLANIPLLTFQEVDAWLAAPLRSTLKRQVQFIKTSITLSKYAFAVTIANDVMEAPKGISFPPGTIVILDPDKPLKNGSYILVQVEDCKLPYFRQFVHDGSKRYLKPLNPRYPVIELNTQKHRICGIVQQAILLM